MGMVPQEFVQIIRENKGIIRSLCKIYFQSNEDQKDAFQEVILQLWKSADRFRGDAKMSTWIYRISLNTILSLKRKNTISVEPIDVDSQEIQTVLADDNLELLGIIIQSLKDIDKAIVLLHLEGYRNKEIGEMLKLSSSNVATRFNRIKAQLKMKYNHQLHATRPS